MTRTSPLATFRLLRFVALVLLVSQAAPPRSHAQVTATDALLFQTTGQPLSIPQSSNELVLLYDESFSRSEGEIVSVDLDGVPLATLQAAWEQGIQQCDAYSYGSDVYIAGILVAQPYSPTRSQCIDGATITYPVGVTTCYGTFGIPYPCVDYDSVTIPGAPAYPTTTSSDIYDAGAVFDVSSRTTIGFRVISSNDPGSVDVDYATEVQVEIVPGPGGDYSILTVEAIDEVESRIVSDYNDSETWTIELEGGIVTSASLQTCLPPDPCQVGSENVSHLLDAQLFSFEKDDTTTGLAGVIPDFRIEFFEPLVVERFGETFTFPIVFEFGAQDLIDLGLAPDAFTYEIGLPLPLMPSSAPVQGLPSFGVSLPIADMGLYSPTFDLTPFSPCTAAWDPADPDPSGCIDSAFVDTDGRLRRSQEPAPGARDALQSGLLEEIVLASDLFRFDLDVDFLLTGAVGLGVQAGVPGATMVVDLADVDLATFWGRAQDLSFDPDLEVTFEFSEPTLVEVSPGSFEALSAFTVSVGDPVTIRNPAPTLVITPVYSIANNLFSNRTEAYVDFAIEEKVLAFGTNGFVLDAIGDLLDTDLTFNVAALQASLGFGDVRTMTLIDETFPLGGFPVLIGTPLTLEGVVDSDGDGLPDGVETATGIFVSGTDTGTDPFSFDSDGDGLSDAAEIGFGTDPNVVETMILARHDGATDPTSEGWVPNVPTSGVTERPVFGDQGFDAWEISDDSTVSGSTLRYLKTPTPTPGFGWVLRTRLNYSDPAYYTANPSSNLSVQVEYSHGTNRYLLGVRANAAGDPVVFLNGGGSVELTGAGPGYHLYELVFDPFASPPSADLFVDGIERLSNYTGDGVVGLDRLTWGSGQSTSVGEGRYNLVEWTVFDGSGDRDRDGLSDAAEVAAGTSPLSADTDGDGLSDPYELANGLDPLDGADALLDFDADGLTALEEQAAGTSPQHADSDLDGLADGAESKSLFSDPLLADSDGDGIADGVDDCRRIANPGQDDADGDGRGDACDYNDPLDLSDPSPRTVVLQFEESLDPAVVGTAFGEGQLWASYLASGDLRVITLAAGEFAAHLAASTSYGFDAATVSDYVLVIDATSGALVSADWSADRAGETWTGEASSDAVGGYSILPAFGAQPVYCEAALDGPCDVAVAASAYDPGTGAIAGLGGIDVPTSNGEPMPNDFFNPLADLRLAERPAPGVTIDFEGVAPVGQSLAFDPVYVEDGFVLDGRFGSDPRFVVASSSLPGAGGADSDFGLAAADPTFALSAAGGTPFVLIGFEAAQTLGAPAGTLTLTGTRVDGGALETSFATASGAFTSFLLGPEWAGLSRVVFSSDQEALAIDRIEAVPIALPEPGLGLLLAAGVAWLGRLGRREVDVARDGAKGA